MGTDAIRSYFHYILHRFLHLSNDVYSIYVPFRLSLCQAIVSASKVQDPSSSLLTTLVTSLLTSFDPTEIYSQNAKDFCASALLTITQLSKSGYIQGVTATSQTLANVISSYAVPPNAAFTSSTSSVYPVETAVRVRSCILDSDPDLFLIPLSQYCMINPSDLSSTFSAPIIVSNLGIIFYFR